MNKLLLVDDDAEMLTLYKMVLETENTVTTADGGEKAFAIAKESKPDLILLDVMMTGINGIETLEKLKADPDTKDIPVAMLTNLVDEATKKSALDKGAIKYFIKSDYDPDQLTKEIDTLIKQ